MLPFARALGGGYAAALPAGGFDFGVPGVTSMSVDTHKYGYAPKGTSVLLFRDAARRSAAYFAYPEWTGGLYTTPTIAGSRNGAVIAGAWASLVSLGHDGFVARTRKILDEVLLIAEGIGAMPQLRLIGARDSGAGFATPAAMIVCFDCAPPAAPGAKALSVYRVNDLMAKRGWSLNALQNPPCVHLCATVRTVGVGKRFLKELAECVAAAEDEVAGAPAGSSTDSCAAIYGLASSMPSGPVSDVLRLYTDITLRA